MKGRNTAVKYNVGCFHPNDKFKKAHKKAHEFILDLYSNKNIKFDLEPIREVVIHISELYLYRSKEKLIETNRAIEYLGKKHPALSSIVPISERTKENGLVCTAKYHLGKDYAYITGFLNEVYPDSLVSFRSLLFKPDLIIC